MWDERCKRNVKLVWAKIIRPAFFFFFFFTLAHFKVDHKDIKRIPRKSSSVGQSSWNSFNLFPPLLDWFNKIIASGIFKSNLLTRVLQSLHFSPVMRLSVSTTSLCTIFDAVLDIIKMYLPQINERPSDGWTVIFSNTASRLSKVFIKATLTPAFSDTNSTNSLPVMRRYQPDGVGTEAEE